MNKILVISGSPKKNGNTAILVDWFAKGAESKGARVEIISAAFLKYKSPGCRSCRLCQKLKKYGCIINDDAKLALEKMIHADVIVMATPLYFFGPSAQLKIIFDRMFSLYKWDNDAGTMESPLIGKTFVLIGSAFEDVGLDIFEKPFALTAKYTKMKFKSILVPDAGVSGDVCKIPGIRKKMVSFGKEVAK